MVAYSTEERLALLLSVLGDEASNAAFKEMHPTRAVFVKRLLQEFRDDPPSKQEVEVVLRDFRSYFSFALKSLKPEVDRAVVRGKVSGGSAAVSAKKSKGADPGEPLQFSPIEESGNFVADLNRLYPGQIVEALNGEHPRTIAVILDSLETTLCGAVLKELDDETRNQAVLIFSEGVTVSAAVADEILATTFRKANAVVERAQGDDRSKVLANLMRTLPRDIRAELITSLTEQNEEFVQSVRSKLYVFDDLLRLDDRDTQKFIAETQTEDLIVALQDCDPEISDKILNNLSKRARQAIEVEIEYKNDCSEQEIEAARESLVATLGSLDEAGEVKLS
ncbi:MAG: FliG C-terminal domain-containing protein [Planctomycetota bacterium]